MFFEKQTTAQIELVLKQLAESGNNLFFSFALAYFALKRGELETFVAIITQLDAEYIDYYAIYFKADYFKCLLPLLELADRAQHKTALTCLAAKLSAFIPQLVGLIKTSEPDNGLADGLQSAQAMGDNGAEPDNSLASYSKSFYIKMLSIWLKTVDSEAILQQRKALDNLANYLKSEDIDSLYKFVDYGVDNYLFKSDILAELYGFGNFAPPKKPASKLKFGFKKLNKFLNSNGFLGKSSGSLGGSSRLIDKSSGLIAKATKSKLQPINDWEIVNHSDNDDSWEECEVVSTKHDQDGFELEVKFIIEAVELLITKLALCDHATSGETKCDHATSGETNLCLDKPQQWLDKAQQWLEYCEQKKASQQFHTAITILDALMAADPANIAQINLAAEDLTFSNAGVAKPAFTLW